jgi:hypothetical protein
MALVLCVSATFAMLAVAFNAVKKSPLNKN